LTKPGRKGVWRKIVDKSQVDIKYRYKGINHKCYPEGDPKEKIVEENIDADE